MSRIGKKPINYTDNIKIIINNGEVIVEGPKGSISRQIPEYIKVSKSETAQNQLILDVLASSNFVNQEYGLYRSLLSNMILGVSKGFKYILELQGVGYRAQVEAGKLLLNVGYSKPVVVEPEHGVVFNVEKNTTITLAGIDKECLGNVAARIRAVRPPEPYKGKGIRYRNEPVILKPGKSGK
jgi:large subunit ribosomal protein L6